MKNVTQKSAKKVSVKIDVEKTTSQTPFIAEPQTVTSLKGLSPYVVYKTTNYGLIKENELNRIDEKREAAFIKKIKKGEFNELVTIFLVNKDTNELHDGHHRFRALKSEKKAIQFLLCEFDKAFHGKKQSMEGIANFNDTNSSWTPADKYIQAVKAGYKVALQLKCLKDRLDSQVDKNKFNAWNILNFALGKNTESGVPIQAYRDKTNYNIVTSIKFQEDFDSLIEIIEKLQLIRVGAKTSDTLKHLSCLRSKGEIDIREFSKKFNVHYKDYNPQSKHSDIVTEEIKKIMRKRS